jgi:beta/gamma crystallin
VRNAVTRDRSRLVNNDGRRRVSINRDRRRILVNNTWWMLVPLVGLGALIVGAETFYADGYVPVPESTCSGFAEDGTRLRWMAVPTEEGGSEMQCVSYSTERNRVVTEIDVPEEPLAAAPVAPPSTVGSAPADEPAAVAAVPPAASTGCELLIYAEEIFKGLSAPSTENQDALSEDGWQNEIASLEIKKGTWDFYSDEGYAGEMMRLGAGSYPKLDPKWSKNIGSFLCSTPGK